MNSDVIRRRILAVAAVLVAITIALPRFLTHTPYQRLGAAVSNGVVERIVGPPAKGRLLPGDALLAVDGMPLADPAVRDSLSARGWPRGSLLLTVERDGRAVDIEMPPVRLTAWERLRIYTYPIAAVIAAPIVAFLLVWRRPDLMTAWAFLWFAALQGLSVVWGLYQFPQGALGQPTQWVLRAHEWLSWMYPASFVHFMSVFPRSRWESGRRGASAWFWLTVAAYVAPLVLWVALGRDGKPPSEGVYNAYQAIALTVGIFSLLERYGRSAPDWRPSGHQRALALFAAFAILTSATLNLVASNPRVMALVPDSTARVLITSILIAWLTAPFVFAYLIAGDPLFDPRRLIVNGLPYALISGVLAAIYLAMVLGGQRVFATVTGEQALVFNVVAALVLAFAFAPLRERVQLAVDRMYGRDPVALRRALDQAGRDLLGALDEGEVRAAVESGIQRGLRRPLGIAWPEGAAPAVAPDESVADSDRAAIEALLREAAIRLDNLKLAEGRAAAERNAVELREAATIAELRALQAQVQPHFLFNALNALAYLIETDAAAAQRFTERLADMLRYTVEAGKRPAALLSDEIAFVEDYLGVARERYEQPLHFAYEGDPGLLGSTVPPLLLQPLVENSLKHGLAPDADALHMSLRAVSRDGWLELEFADDGCPNGANAPGLSVGLDNLEQRVRRFAGAEAVLESGPASRVGSTGGEGFVVRMRWPINGGGIR
ncbi:MAG: histidine kinase [Candidatus Eisenbacteria bacterium]|nr:histidine kinase [Candidatus Eisenbacteria bacterium]